MLGHLVDEKAMDVGFCKLGKVSVLNLVRCVSSEAVGSKVSAVLIQVLDCMIMAADVQVHAVLLDQLEQPESVEQVGYILLVFRNLTFRAEILFTNALFITSR